MIGRKRVYEVVYAAMVGGRVTKGEMMVTTRRKARIGRRLNRMVAEHALSEHRKYPEKVLVVKLVTLSEKRAREATLARLETKHAEMIARIRRESVEHLVSRGLVSSEDADAYLTEKGQ